MRNNGCMCQNKNTEKAIIEKSLECVTYIVVFEIRLGLLPLSCI